MASRHEEPRHLEASRFIERTLSAMDRCGLTPTEYRVLAALADDGCAIVDLAGQLDRPAVAVRRAARQLAMKGLIRRHRGPRRNVWLSLTSSGLATLQLLTATAMQQETAPATRACSDRSLAS